MKPKKASIQISDRGISVELKGIWCRRDIDQASRAMLKEIMIQRSKRIVGEETSDE